MKKIVYSIILTLFALFPINVLAEGYVSVSTSSITIEQGNTETFTISTYNVIGDITIVSNNPSIATVSMSKWETGMTEEKETKSETISITGVGVGTTTITLNIDAATFDEEDLSGQTKTINITVVEKNSETPEDSDNNNDKDDEKQDDDTYELKLYFEDSVNLYKNNNLITNSSPYIINIKSNEEQKLDDYIAKKEGYTFVGWDTSNICNSPRLTGIYNADTSLYACFKINKIDSENNSDQEIKENPKTGNYSKFIILIIITLFTSMCSIIYLKKVRIR